VIQVNVNEIVIVLEMKNYVKNVCELKIIYRSYYNLQYCDTNEIVIVLQMRNSECMRWDRLGRDGVRWLEIWYELWNVRYEIKVLYIK